MMGEKTVSGRKRTRDGFHVIKDTGQKGVFPMRNLESGTTRLRPSVTEYSGPTCRDPVVVL